MLYYIAIYQFYTMALYSASYITSDIVMMVVADVNAVDVYRNHISSYV